MPNTNASGPKYRVTVADNANTLILGDASEAVVGTYAIHFVNSGVFVGSLTVVCRSRVPAAADPAQDNVAFVACQYLSIYVNGVIGTNGFGSAAITTTSVIFVPATGLQIGLLVTCSSGFGVLYISRHAGAAA